jgi:hypothetical protein
VNNYANVNGNLTSFNGWVYGFDPGPKATPNGR